ncbi:hypothetical protein QJS10_CPB14g01237 [Acorus calamus]|uniref:Spatacsin C-terminal domain-containing protein n=1 Tax=Acorus calamus TaxID=4465 RepID=A0AAV9DG99_ACOCL|nr:hypothetical protein QJS10_CPB14g01237 [Acorus calamus]
MVLSSPELESERADGLASSHAGSLVTLNNLGSGNLDEFSVSDAQGRIGRKKLILSENPRDMIARWEIDKPDLQTVVKDALHSGRLPLAVLQLHRQQLRDMVTEREPSDTFSEIRDVGRTIAYDLFLKGEVRLAIETLQRLGEDIETSLRQLAFGTVSRSLRANITEEMKRFGYLQPHERKTLERISLIERLYPSSSFWGTLLARQRKLSEVSPTEVFPQEKMMEKIRLHVHENFTIECGEIDGVVIGPWANLGNGLSASLADESTAEAGYWACAAVWSDAWDERTMDRIVLDQPLLMGVHIPWESQFEYHVYHNNWEEVSKLLDVIPASLLSNRNLQVNLDVPCSASNDECNKGFPDHAKHIWPTDEIDAVCLNIPNVKILRLSALNVCSAWLRMLVEQELAKKFIFIKEYWEVSSLIFGNNLLFRKNTPAQAGSHWVKWLLLSRAKGREYESSFSNARAIASQNMVLKSNISVLEMDDIICSVDDMAEGGGETAALATLMYAPSPIQTCLCSGSVNRNACFGQDALGGSLNASAGNAPDRSAFSDYLAWRASIFSSPGGDTSLVQMLPCWFPKPIRRLINLFVQGPLGWESFADGAAVVHPLLHHDIDVCSSNGNTQRGSVSCEASIQKHIEEELYSSSFVVVPLAITHFVDSAFVASCAFLLELCGISASMLYVDIAALHRISSVFKLFEHDVHHEHASPKGSTFHVSSHDTNEIDFMGSLARILADDYLYHDTINSNGQKDAHLRMPANRHPSRAIITVLRHLEKASLPMMDEGGTCGSWLRNGNGDGAEYRARQKAASQHWCWVTEFCQVHHLPLSTKYLSLLAKDNDWVGFLTEAQIGGFPFDVIFQIASKEFSDPPLKVHILTVLKSIESARGENNPSLSSTSEAKNNESSFLTERNTMIPVELFGLLAECEKQNHPGEALLSKAKDLRWSLLAIIASCYPDVPPLSCLTVWLEISAASRETSAIKVNDIVSQIANNVGAAVDAMNALSTGDRTLTLHYNRRNPKRRRLLDPASENSIEGTVHSVADASCSSRILISQESSVDDEAQERVNRTVSNDPDVGLISLSKMIAVLCEQRLFLPLLRAFEMFLPNCALLPLIRAFQAFSQMRLSEASAHLASFSARFKEEPYHTNFGTPRDVPIKATWISSTAIKTADAMLSTCPSAYEKRCLLQLLSVVEFGDGGSAAARFGRHYWKINLAEPSLRKDEDSYLGNEILDDAALLNALEKNGQWEQACNWARQLESSGSLWKSCVHHVTKTQAEAMVAEWKEFLWDVPEERAALWSHCQTLFLRYSFPAGQAGLFFLKHAEAVEKDIPSRELHEMLLLSLQWLSGTITQSSLVYPLHLLREIETRVWLLAVESEAQATTEGNFTLANSIQNPAGGSSTSIIEHTANVITRMDNHINTVRARATEKNDTREGYQNPRNLQTFDSSPSATSNSKTKRRAKGYISSRRSLADAVDKKPDLDDYSSSCMLVQEENAKIEASISGWEERVKPAEVERAILSLLDFGQVTAAKQLQNKLSPSNVLPEFALVDTALKLASASCPSSNGEASVPNMDPDILPIVRSYDILDHDVLEILATKFNERCGRGLCKRIVAVVKAAKVLGVSFSEAFDKRPIELLQLLSLKAQDSLEEAKILVQTHVMSPASIAQILAEAFLKAWSVGCASWRIYGFTKGGRTCPTFMEVELLILSHHFYKSSACLDGVDVLVALAATKVEAYVSEGDFSCLARLVTGVSNFHALHFILGILIENGQLELLLQKYSATDTTTSSAEAVRGFRMAVLTSLKHFNPHDLDAFAMVYSHFDMKHEMASLLESRSRQSIQQWYLRYNHEQNEDLLEAMRLYIEAAEVHSTIDAGHKTGRACAVASLLSLQIRIPDLSWLDLSETNARRALVEQSNFQEALIVADAYNLNHPGEWAPVLWNQMLKPEVMERFVAEFVVVLPLQTSMLLELARFYRAEVAARGDQHSFSVWLSPGGLPAEWVKHLGRSFRSLLRRTRDLRVRLQLATLATGFGDVVDGCQTALDRVPETAGPLVLRKGHGGAYLPLM